MPENTEKKPGRFAEDKGKIAWTLLAILLICMPLVAIGQLVVATDDELEDVGAQYLFRFDRVHRNILGPNYYNHEPGGDNWNTRGMISYDAAVLTIDSKLLFRGIRVSGTSMGYWNDGSGLGWDVDLRDASDGIIFGGKGYTMTFNGMRIELAYDNLASANPNMLFFRMGTDSLTGCFDFTPDGTQPSGTTSTGGSIQRISVDGRIYGHTGQTNLGIMVNSHRANQFFGMNQWPLGDVYVPTVKVWEQFYGTTGPGANFGGNGATDFYFSLSNAIYDHEGGAVNVPRAYNVGAYVNSHIPGRGWWIHFNDSYANCGLW